MKRRKPATDKTFPKLLHEADRRALTNEVELRKFIRKGTFYGDFFKSIHQEYITILNVHNYTS